MSTSGRSRAAGPDETPAIGRPRDANRDVAILDATLLLLTEVGYDQLSMESIAARAGVAKTTIYRRYRDKVALVAAAVEYRSQSSPPAVGPGGLRGNLLTLVQWLAEQIAEQEIGLLGALFAGMRSDPGLAAEMRRILRRDEAAMTDQPLREAVKRGERLAPHAAELFAEVAPAVIVHRIVVAGETCDERFVEHLVDDILLPLLRGHPNKPARTERGTGSKGTRS
ncbi:TetR/AcrR family transcriptional regulator [Amycolatopsis acidiphila]|uniref:TetR/AcrR family transcriptional regulator n=1 Tax=Amycolatopsis acidiphila TaxID=715473 RepID=A0A558ALD0_9PSEU|nr:TetR/AcrR family transcriptional regulator [Amycolatopsis acidiphila]TVT25064.1 TetR/AcrR family transcriptional regulator [Amycolatopsis acidiphila]UIJ57424.1 TetR/AcrR family transcriptional regulator [Amycolatopsis acidiphila]GHG84314.1 TetR family transcriptional regulator [Amycolatopsis acidiphila]